jgi:hypothetical protein
MGGALGLAARASIASARTSKLLIRVAAIPSVSTAGSSSEFQG